MAITTIQVGTASMTIPKNVVVQMRMEDISLANRRWHLMGESQKSPFNLTSKDSLLKLSDV